MAGHIANHKNYSMKYLLFLTLLISSGGFATEDSEGFTLSETLTKQQAGSETLTKQPQEQVNPSLSTDFDYGEFSGMDVFSRPDLFGQEYEAFNGLSRAEKMPIILDAIAGDKTDEIAPYPITNFQCGQFAKLTAVNTFGCKNFIDFIDYPSYKNHPITNGKYNLPVYMVSTVTQGTTNSEGVVTNVGGHAINAIFVGPKNSNEKHDPTKFNQWYFFEPQTDKEVKPGDFSMNKNGDVNIYWFGYSSPDGQEWGHDDSKILAFDLNNGEATLDPGFGYGGIAFYLLREDPHTTKIKMSPLEGKLVEMGSSAPNTSPEVTGIPAIETNLEHYSPTLTHTDKDTTYLMDSAHPEYFSFTRKFMADVKMGRWSGSNLPNLKDSTSQKITVDDTVAPVVVAPADVTIGYNSSTGIERTGAASATDDSPYPIEMWYEDSVISEDANYKIIERTHFGADVRENIGNGKQKITIDLNVGVDEAKKQNGFDVQPQYGPNGINLKTFTSKHGDISLEVFNMNGQLLRQKHYGPFNKQDMWIRQDGIFKPGMYVVRGTFVDSKGNKYLDWEKVLVE